MAILLEYLGCLGPRDILLITSAITMTIVCIVVAVLYEINRSRLEKDLLDLYEIDPNMARKVAHKMVGGEKLMKEFDSNVIEFNRKEKKTWQSR